MNATSQNTSAAAVQIYPFCAILYNMEAKSAAQVDEFSYPLFAKWVRAKNYVGRIVHVSDSDCSKFAAKYDWSSEFFQNVQKFFSGKIDEFFEKNSNFLKALNLAKFL